MSLLLVAAALALIAGGQKQRAGSRKARSRKPQLEAGRRQSRERRPKIEGRKQQGQKQNPKSKQQHAFPKVSPPIYSDTRQVTSMLFRQSVFQGPSLKPIHCWQGQDTTCCFLIGMYQHLRLLSLRLGCLGRIPSEIFIKLCPFQWPERQMALSRLRSVTQRS